MSASEDRMAETALHSAARVRTIREQGRQTRATAKAEARHAAEGARLRSQLAASEHDRLWFRQQQDRAQDSLSRQAQYEARQAQERRQRMRSATAGSAMGALSGDGGGGGGLRLSAPTAGSDTLMTVVFLIVGLSLLDFMVTHADQFSGFAATIGDTLHKVSSTTPLFTAASTSK